MKFQKYLKPILRILFLSYLGLIALLYFAQDKLIFSPNSLPQDYKFQFKTEFSEKFVNSQGLKIHSLIFKASNSKGLILFFHGNGGAMDVWGEVAEEISNKYAWDVWVVDYPGYGKSSGAIESEEQLLTFAGDVFKEAKSAYPTQKIILYGRSMGSGLAVKLASQNSIAGLILETPYTSISDVAQSYIPFIPLSIVKYPMPSKNWIGQVKAPVLVVHGTADEVVPFEQGEALAAMAGRATFVEIPGGHHNDLSTFKEYWTALAAYLN